MSAEGVIVRMCIGVAAFACVGAALESQGVMGTPIASASPTVLQSSTATSAPFTTTATGAPSPCTPGSPHQDCISRCEAKVEVEAAGRSWREFLADTTDRPRYERVFISLWLDS